MSVYMIVEIEIRNEEMYGEYVAKVPAVVHKYGGRYIVRGGKVTPLGGNWRPQRLIILEFESAARMLRFSSSPEYRDLAPLRENSTSTRSIAVEGVARPT